MSEIAIRDKMNDVERDETEQDLTIFVVFNEIESDISLIIVNYRSVPLISFIFSQTEFFNDTK
jgi:hypothetical protein